MSEYFLITTDGNRFDNITGYVSMPYDKNNGVVVFRTTNMYIAITVNYQNIDWFNSNLPPQPSFFLEEDGLGGGNRKKKQSKKKQVKNNKSKKNRRR
jgi:hypothetical protein